MALKYAIHKQSLKNMKKRVLILATAALTLSACKSPYSDWEMPNVVRNNKTQPVNRTHSTSRSSQVQPQFETPKTTSPAPAQQVQPEFRKPKQKVQPKLKKQEQVAEQPPIPAHLHQHEPKKTEQVTAPAPKPEQQIQPKLENPKPIATPTPETEPAPTSPKSVTPPVKTEPQKISVAETALPNTQVQPSFTRPTQQQNSAPRPVMTQAQKEKYPVMPGQNRALKRRR